MEIIIHRINSIRKLKKIPYRHGVEIDVRSLKSNLILNHEPKKNGDKLSDYLNSYNNGTIVFNIKEAGIEYEVMNLAKKFKIKSFFLLDVEHPFIIKSKKFVKKNLAVRFSEFEPIALSNEFKRFAEWMWIDTIHKLPINKKNLKIIKNFKTCLVSPERWKRKKDIKKYLKFFKTVNYKPDAVMTDLNCSRIWEEVKFK